MTFEPGLVSSTADAWVGWAGRALLDGSLAFAIVAALWWPFRKRAPARVACALFLLVLVKLALPVDIAAPAWLTPWLPSSWVDAALAAPGPELVVAAAPAAALARFAADPVPAASPVWPTSLFVGWLVIAAFLLVRFAAVQVKTARIARRARPLRAGELPIDVDALRRRAGVRRQVRWLVSDDVDSPATGGIARCYVLLPAGLLPRLAPSPLRWILLHELAHVRRGDVAVAFAQRLVQIALFFHPVVWLVNRIVDEHRELACDEEALAASGAGRAECGEGFLSVVEWARAHPAGAAATLAMFDSKSTTRRRLMRILDSDRRTSGRRSLTSAAAILGAAVLLLPSARAAAPQDPGRGDRGQLKELREEIQELKQLQRELRETIKRLERTRSRTGGEGESEVEEIVELEEVIELEEAVELEGVIDLEKVVELEAIVEEYVNVEAGEQTRRRSVVLDQDGRVLRATIDGPIRVQQRADGGGREVIEYEADGVRGVLVIGGEGDEAATIRIQDGKLRTSGAQGVELEGGLIEISTGTGIGTGGRGVTIVKPDGVVTGRVLDQDGNPLRGVHVRGGTGIGAGKGVTVVRPDGITRGRVVDQEGQPVSGVILRSAGDGGETVVETDAEGRFRIQGIKTAPYKLRKLQYGRLLRIEDADGTVHEIIVPAEGESKSDSKKAKPKRKKIRVD